MEFDLSKHTIYFAKHGSHAYGTNTPTSDLDVKGVAIAPLEYYLGVSKKFEQAEKYASKGADLDQVIYDLQKFVHLAANANPNILEVLFVDEEDIIEITSLGKKLRDNSSLFITKKIRKSMAGYAHDQAHKIRSHRNWLLNPPSHKPTREEFNLSPTSKITPSEMGAYEALIEKGENLPEHVMVIIQREKQYANAARNWSQYQNWKASRNEKRAILEAKFGYDTKHAYHLVRLMRMAKEVLEGKGVIVKRPDAQELLEIRDGAWTYDQLMSWFDAQDAALDSLYEASTIPKEPDRKKLDKLTMELIMEFHDIQCITKIRQFTIEIGRELLKVT